MGDKFIQLNKITKLFPGTVALNEADFDVCKGEVHAIVGENGAGKSTLMKILSGVYKKTSGSLQIDGEETIIHSTTDSLKLGITMIYQELANIPNLSVAENIFVGRLPSKGILKIVDFKKLFSESKDIFKKYDINIDITKKVSSLTVAEKQFVEIIKAITAHSARLIIMDEPTSSLTKDEIEKLFNIIDKLRSEGVSIVYISHRMDEVFQIADRITVFRDGKNCVTQVRSEFDEKIIISAMLGHSLKKDNKKIIHRSEVLFEVKNLSIKNRVHDFSMKLYRGEVLGIAGLMGSGKDELVKCLFGLWPAINKELIFMGKSVHIKSPRDALKLGMVYLPEERKTQSLFLDLNVKDNLITIWLYNQFKRLFNNRKAENLLCKDYIGKFSIKAASLNQEIINLSGGNQQKVILSRLLAVKPQMMILNDPTRGIDIGSKEEIYRIIGELAENGTSIVVVSSELEEICNISHRVLILSKGTVHGEFNDEDVLMENILPCAVRMKKHVQ